METAEVMVMVLGPEEIAVALVSLKAGLSCHEVLVDLIGLGAGLSLILGLSCSVRNDLFLLVSSQLVLLLVVMVLKGDLLSSP